MVQSIKKQTTLLTQYRHYNELGINVQIVIETLM
jgi:hypothetical protein